MIGLDFLIPNQWGNFLSKILDGVSIQNGIWKLAEEEILIKEGNYLFDKTIYNDEEFKQLINSNEYYIIFANIQLYSEHEDEVIRNYIDYKKSKCTLILSVIDNIYVQVYSKDLTMLNQINKNLIDNDFQNVRVITEDNELKNLFPNYNDINM